MTTLMKNNRKLWGHSVGLRALVFLMSMLVPTLCLAQLPPPVLVGPGYSDVSPHQLVRDNSPDGGYVYVIAPTCPGNPPWDCAGSLVGYKSHTTTNIQLFDQLPALTMNNADVLSSAIAIDNTATGNKIHVLWNTKGQPGNGGYVYYTTFNTGTNQWSTPIQVDNTHWTDLGITIQRISQGDEGVALALDAQGTPHAAWSYREAEGNFPLHIRYANYNPASQTWSTPIRIDDPDPDPANQRYQSWHPTSAFTAAGDLVVAWEEGNDRNSAQGNNDDGLIRVRTRFANGTWSAIQILKDNTNQNAKMWTGNDQGPSLLITADGVQHLVAINGDHSALCLVPSPVCYHPFYWYNDSTGWKFDLNFASQQPNVQTHNPSVGPDGTNVGVWLSGHGIPGPPNLYHSRKATTSGQWSPWTQFRTGTYDSTVSIRWSQFFQYYPASVDILYWASTLPNTLYFNTLPLP